MLANGDCSSPFHAEPKHNLATFAGTNGLNVGDTDAFVVAHEGDHVPGNVARGRLPNSGDELYPLEVQGYVIGGYVSQGLGSKAPFGIWNPGFAEPDKDKIRQFVRDNVVKPLYPSWVPPKE